MSFSDFYASDLTDITSSSEEEQPTLHKVKKLSIRKPKIDQCSAYNVTNPLRPPRSTNYSVRSLYGIFSILFFSFFCSPASEQIIDGTINLDPDYQRGALWLPRSCSSCRWYTPLDIVWSEQKQIGLIDSVFRNYYIPPIIFGLSFISHYYFSSRSHLPPSCLYVERW